MSALLDWCVAHHAAFLGRNSRPTAISGQDSAPVESSGDPGQLPDPPRPDEPCPDEDEGNAATANVTIPELGSAVPLVEVPLA